MLNFEKYVINENVQKSKKILKDLNIPETNKNYLSLRKLLSRNIGYLGKFTDWHFNQNYSIQRLQDLYKKIKDSNLNKSIDEFKTPEHIIDFIIEKNKNSKEKKIEKSIPKNIKNLLIYDDSDYDDDSNGYQTEIEYFNKFIKDISVKVPDNKLDMVCDYFRNKSARCLDQDEPYEYLDDVIDTIVNINPDDIYKNIRNDNKKNLTILIDNDEYLFFICHNYKSCEKYGSKFWCIVEDEGTFEDYTEDAVQSILFFKEKIPFIDKESVLGMTINIDDYKISAAHWEDDNECNIKNYNPNKSKNIVYDTILNTIDEKKSIINNIYSICLENKIENNSDKFATFIRMSDDKHIFDFIKRKTFKTIIEDYEIDDLSDVDFDRMIDILFKNNYNVIKEIDIQFIPYILENISSNFLIRNYNKLFNKEVLIKNISWIISDCYDIFHKFIILYSMFNIELINYYKEFLGDKHQKLRDDEYNQINKMPNDKFMINYKLITEYVYDDILKLSNDKIKLILTKDPEIFLKNLDLFEIFLKDSNLYNEYKDKIYDKISKMNKSEMTKISSVIINNDLEDLYPFIIKNILPSKIMDKYDITYTKK